MVCLFLGGWGVVVGLWFVFGLCGLLREKGALSDVLYSAKDPSPRHVACGEALLPLPTTFSLRRKPHNLIEGNRPSLLAGIAVN